MADIIIAADLNHYNNEQMNRVYDTAGIAPTVLVVSGGGREIKIMERGNEALRTLKVNDIFCGCGGMGLGFKKAGFEIAGAWDFDKYAVEAYAHNIGEHVKKADVLDMVHTDLPYADVWTYGAPCQAFSIAGQQLGMMFVCTGCGHEQMFDGEQIIDRITPCELCGEKSEPKDIRGILFFEVMRLLKETRSEQPQHLPAMIMLENVRGISKYLDVIEYEYKKRGYRLIEKTIYNSRFWGLPQNRERYFLVGIRDDITAEFKMPEQQEDYTPKLQHFLDADVDEKYYMSEERTANLIMKMPEGLRVKQATKLGYDIAVEGDTINISHPKSKTRRGRVGKQVAQTLLTGNEQVVVYSSLTERRTEKAKEIRRESWKSGIDFNPRREREVVPREDDVANCVTARGPGSSVEHWLMEETETDLKFRYITPREYARLQGFGEDFEIIHSDRQAYKQFGNAVSVPVAQAIAERMKMFLLSL